MVLGKVLLVGASQPMKLYEVKPTIKLPSLFAWTVCSPLTSTRVSFIVL